MAHDVFAVADRLVSHIKSICPDEVDLVAYYGSHAQGVATERSDLDFFYVPRPGCEPAIARSFLLGGRLYDFWPLSWQTLAEFTVGTQRGWAFAPALVHHAQILYARNDEAAIHLAELKERIHAMQQEPARPAMVRRALGQFAVVQAEIEALRQGQGSADSTFARYAGWPFIAALWECLALANQVFFDRGLQRSLAMTRRFELRPAHMQMLLERIVNAVSCEDIIAAGQQLALETRQLLVCLQQSLPALSIGEAFGGAYPELKDALNKVVAACRSGERTVALAAAFSAQRELDGLLAATLYGVADMRFNRHGEVAGVYRALGLPELFAGDLSDLDALAAVVGELDDTLRSVLVAHGVELNEFVDLSGLEQSLS
jgi:hypothetical protein